MQTFEKAYRFTINGSINQPVEICKVPKSAKFVQRRSGQLHEINYNTLDEKDVLRAFFRIV